ncbi:ATP-DEPENDENT RNA HELICASE [Salix purpurea]|uniref:RNA helicase n=1 Tax=Salix purpurea TaxID=77065 RepID=A0A9Q0W483_SALPP|nr:ATP-DEPENDENT RNA HELICASE [Salix purpurea]
MATYGFTYPVRAHFLENLLEITGYRLTPYNQIDDYGQEKDMENAKNKLKHSKRGRARLLLLLRMSLKLPTIKGIAHTLGSLYLAGIQTQLVLTSLSIVLLLACHGSMASSEQRLIFDKPEDGVRKIVLATNMAETSITINDVVFVVDCGKAKETSYDALNNTPCLLPSWISKAAARQRRGRAGRVQPGECYHLYPRSVYDAFADYQLPELLRTPLQSLCLQIKSLQLGSISEFLSRALQPPEPLSVQNAVDYLKVIGALDEHENLTVLGRHLSVLPVEPKLGKMLILGTIFNCLDPIMTVVAGLSVRDPFLIPFDKKDLAESAKAQFSARDCSDHIALVRAYNGWKDAERQQSGYWTG